LKSVLFVCSGNTCRSPMAETIFGELADDHPRLQDLDIHVESAGTFACEGAEMTPYAVEALEELGFKAHRHKAQALTAELAEEADLILAMQDQHLEEICAIAPEAEDKVHTLKGYAHHQDGYIGGEQYDIEDPFREPLDVYIECAQELKENIQLLLERLEKEWAEA
jgi:protein-tyrosine-phosphatase